MHHRTFFLPITSNISKYVAYFTFSTLKLLFKVEHYQFNRRNATANIPNIFPQMPIIGQNKSVDLYGRLEDCICIRETPGKFGY